MYKPKVGDVVDITARSVLVTNTYTTGEKPVDGPMVDTGTILVYQHPGDTRRDRSHTMNMGAEGVTVTACAPEVRPRDVVADRDGDLLLAIGDGYGELRLVGAVGTFTLDELVEQFGPIRLVWREGEEAPALATDPAPKPAETEMWTFAVHVPRGSVEQVQQAIETVPGAEVYRAYVNGLNRVVLPSGAVPARQGCPDHMPKPYALCLACHTGQDGDQ